MKKALKNFCITVVVAVIYFIISLIIQYYFSVGIAIKTMVGIAMASGFFGFITGIAITDITSPDKKFSTDIFILKLIMILVSFSFLLIISTTSNAILNHISFICLCVGLALAVICILYLAIKALIEEYNKYKERQ